MRNRLLALVNAALIPYVAVRYPRNLGTYLRYTGRVLVTGKRWRDPPADPKEQT